MAPACRAEIGTSSIVWQRFGADSQLRIFQAGRCTIIEGVIAMIECGQARNLFDGYLNEELSASWTTELHAHAVSCGDCRRALSMLAACGDVIAEDTVGPIPSEDFTDRVLSATWEVRRRGALTNRWRTISIWSGASATAAAAAILLWFVPLGGVPSPEGGVSSSETRVRGVVVEGRAESDLRSAKVFTVQAMESEGSGEIDSDSGAGALYDLVEILADHQRTEGGSEPK